MQLKKCPVCGNKDLGDRWSSKGRRLLEQYCDGIDEDEVLKEEDTREEYHHGWNMWVRVCNWVGEARTPEIQKIVKSSSHMFNKSGCYEIFDRFGHCMCLSGSSKSKAEAMAQIQKELKRGVADEDAGPYKALWWSSAGAYDRGTFVDLIEE